jgi:hypothetical protein
MGLQRQHPPLPPSLRAAFIMASNRPTAPSLLLLILFVLIASGGSTDVPQTCPAGDPSCATTAEKASIVAAAVSSASSHTSEAEAPGAVPGFTNPSPEAIEGLLIEKQRLSAMLERSISRVRELEAVLASPSCPCSSGASSFALPLPGAADASAADAGISGEYTGPDQHTLAKEAQAAAAAAEVARVAALEKERAEAEVKRVHAAKQLARATCTLPSLPSP